MQFDEDATHQDLRDGVRRVCSKFPDEYWRRLDAEHEFPWEFYEAMAEGGWIGVAMPEAYGGGGLGITEASIVLEEVAASGAAMNGCSALHTSMFGMNPVVKHGSDDAARSGTCPRSSRAGCTSPSASPSPMPAPTRRASPPAPPATATSTGCAAARSG